MEHRNSGRRQRRRPRTQTVSVIGAVIYALVFTGVMLVIGRNLPSVIQMQRQSEAENFWLAANEIREVPAITRRATEISNGRVRFGTRCRR